jgi:hypothetical protein
MANINLYDTYNKKRRKFGVNDSTRFQESFVEAVNLTYGEMNNLVFQANTLAPINSFDDVIDKRLASFSTITFDTSPTSESLNAISDREFWSAEYDFERLSDTNGFTDTITDGTNVVISIASGVLTVTHTGLVVGTLTLPDLDTFTLRVESYSDGNKVLINGDEYGLTYTTGDADTTIAIGTVTAHVVSATTGYTLNRMRFLSSATVVYDFLINEGTGVTLTDEVGAYTATVDATKVWETVYIEPSSGLDQLYVSPFDMGLDYHLQDGGEWAIEAEPERERKWYGRGIQNARNTFQNTTTYSNPLGI